MLNKLFESFMEFPDLRCAGRTAHRFIDVLVIAVCAVIAGAETWIDIRAGFHFVFFIINKIDI